MQILFAGSPGIAVPALEAVATMGANAEGFTLVGLLTNPDRAKGRSGRPEPTECAAAIRAFAPSIPVLNPEKLDNVAINQVATLKPDLLVSFAYGTIFSQKFLNLFPLGGINIHPSLLPKYRGPTPIPAAIANRESETGLTIQKLAEKMDSGDILVQETVPLDGRETTVGLSETMAQKSALLLPAVLRGIAGGTLEARQQDHGAATYCHLLTKEDGIIAWEQSAPEIEARIRAFTPWPLCWTMHGELQLSILKAEALNDTGNAKPGQVLGKDRDKGILIQTGNGILAASELQYQAKKVLNWNVFLNGARNFIGTQLG